MSGSADDYGALDETIVFLSHFKDLPDPRQIGKVTYPLEEVLLLCLLAVLAGAECFTEIARFGERKLALLRRLRPFLDGTPSHDHLGDILATLDAEAFQRGFVAWVASLTGVSTEVIAIDGKPCADPDRRRAARRPSTWSRRLLPASALCSAKSRWRTSPMRSSPSPGSWIC